MATSSSSSRRDRFVDTKQPIIVSAYQMRGNVQDVYRVASVWNSTGEDKIAEMLATERRSNSDYNTAWINAEQIFETRKLKLSATVGTRRLGDLYHKAVIVYTLEDPPVYRKFNELSRGLTEATWGRFPYKSLWLMLSTALPSLKSDPALPRDTILYRGMGNVNFTDMSVIEPGNIVMFNTFASSTTNEQVARGFLGDAGTLVELHNRPMAGSGIRKHSRFPDEDEVLLCPWTSYTVKSHVRSGKIQRLVLQVAGPLSGSLPYNYNLGK